MCKFLKRILSQKVKRNILKLLVFPYLLYYRYIRGNRIWIRRNSSDVNVFYHTFIEQEFSIPYPIKNPQFIIDGGAYIGLTALLFTKQYPSAQILAIEPESSNYKLLVMNTKDVKNIIPLQNGLWSSDKKLKIENPENEKWGFITNEVEGNAKYDIDGISVNTLMSTYQIDTIDIFKIDIEGSEKELFSRNEEKWLTKTKWIVIEIHGSDCKYVFENAMSKYGFKHIYTNGENQYYANTHLVNI